MTFEANQGQTDSQVKFLARGSGSILFLTSGEAVLVLTGREARAKWDESPRPGPDPTQPEKVTGTVLRMKLVGANPEPRLAGLEELPGKVNYFIGNDPTNWRTNVPTYARVEYRDIYPGVNMVYYGNQQRLEYDFVLAPGADPKVIRLAVEGADTLTLDKHGNLILHTPVGEVVQRAPLVYQVINGARREISGRYVLQGMLKARSQVGFQVGAYDARLPLVIDPTFFYSMYLGGSGDEGCCRIGVDGAGNAYIAGTTTSPSFPITSGAYHATPNGIQDVFVSKLNPAGSALVYSTYLGGAGSEELRTIAVDASGNAYVAGITTSSNFPTTPGAFKTALGSAFQNAFVTKLDLTGSSLVYSTYLGGSSGDRALAMAVDASGSAYVTGQTISSDFPTTPGVFEPVMLGSGGSAFVTKLNSTGTGLAYSTFLSAVGDISSGFGIAVDASGNACVTGSTASSTFPTTPGSFQTTFAGGGVDAFVTKLNPTGSALVYSTYLGGSGSESVHAIAVDGSGNAYVAGATNSLNFPTTPGAFQTVYGGVADLFVSKLNSTGTGLIYSTFLGGSGYDDARKIAVDTAGNAYLTGVTESTDFPTTAAAMQPTFGGGGDDAFVTVLNSTGSGLLYSTYLGGRGSDHGEDIAIDASGNAHVTGLTSSNNFPTTPGAYNFAGAVYDGFVAKISNILSPPVAQTGSQSGDPSGGQTGNPPSGQSGNPPSGQTGSQTGKVTGDGKVVTVTGADAEFHFDLKRKVAGGPLDGHLSYENHASGAKVRSTGFTSLAITGNTATFAGTCTNNAASCTFTVAVQDNGSGHGGNDSFTISISGGPPEGGKLRNGHIEIH